MNFKRIFIFPLLTLVVMITEVSCWKSETILIEWNSIYLENLKAYYENNSLNYEITDSLIFAPLSYGIKIHLDQKDIISQTKFNFSLIQSVNAFTKVKDKYVLKDKVTAIQIKTLNDFDDNHLADSDITTYFNTLENGELITLESKLDVSDGLSENASYDFQLDIFLVQNSTFNNKQQFEIIIKFDSGKTLSQHTDLIEIR